MAKPTRLSELDTAKLFITFFTTVHQSDQMLRFLTDLERLVVSFVVCRVPHYRRIDRYCEILQAMYEGKDLYAPSSPLQLKVGEREEFLRKLDGDIYQGPLCRYILLRLDEKLSEGKASYDYQTITVEHVLPQRPAPDSEWMDTFPVKEIRDKYVHRLGNLVLLSQGKNMRAENYDFDVKKRKYFTTKDGISPFVLTTQVLRYREWIPAIVDQRQRESNRCATIIMEYIMLLHVATQGCGRIFPIAFGLFGQVARNRRQI